MTQSTKIKRSYFQAYCVTLKILWRYIWLGFLRLILGEWRLQSAWKRAHKKSADDVLTLLQKQKGIFIKLGQTLSVMSHLLPSEFTERLERLQDDVPPHHFEDIRERFILDFGCSPETLFERIDTKPLASASLAQVHVAYLKTGEKVAVKVQYPHIEQLTHKDLVVLRRLFGWFDFVFPQFNFKTIFTECEQMILDELDYAHEAQNIELLQKHFEHHSLYVFPKVYSELSSQKILTMSFIEGVKVTDFLSLEKQGVNREELCDQVLHFFCKQIFEEGVYHADPHPGNIIITPQGQLALIDFGAVATISESMRQGLTHFVEGLIRKDAKMLSQALKNMGFVTVKSDEETLDTVVDYFYSKVSALKIDNFKKLDISAFHNLEDLVELKKMDVSFRELTSLFTVPKDWILLERTLFILSGLSSQLNEKHNPMQTVLPYVENFLMGPDKPFSELIAQAGKELVVSYLNLPHVLERTLKKVNQGQVDVQIQGLNGELAKLRKVVSLFSLAFLSVLSWIGYGAFYSYHLEEIDKPLFYSAIVFCVLFVLRLIKK